MLGSYVVPISLGGSLPGVLSTVVVEGRIPWLLPVGLMKALKGRLDLDKGIIEWQAKPGAVSQVCYLASRHRRGHRGRQEAGLTREVE